MPRGLGPRPGEEKPLRQNGFAGLASRAVRSSHCGFDCYLNGKTNSGVGRVRILARKTRLPPSLSDEVRYRIPEEMFWPEPDPTMAHCCIDAVLTLDVNKLAEWQTYYPGHVFGFEQFLHWAKEKVERRSDDPDRYKKTQTEAESIFRKFPIDRIIRVQRISSLDEGAYTIVISYVHFANGDEAVRITLYGNVSDDSDPLILSRAYIDPLDNRFDITEHFPGRYAALHLPESLINDLLGVQRFKILRRSNRGSKPRTSLTLEPAPDAAADWRDRRPHSRRVSERAGLVHDEVLGPDKLVRPEPLSSPVAVADLPAEDPEPTEFPSAPGLRTR